VQFYRSSMRRYGHPPQDLVGPHELEKSPAGMTHRPPMGWDPKPGGSPTPGRESHLRARTPPTGADAVGTHPRERASGEDATLLCQQGTQMCI
jgi:hypothetical protein